MTMTKTEFPAFGETLYSAVLPNGLPVYVMPKPGYRRTFAVLAANYGGADRVFEADGVLRRTPAGVAHYLEHKLFDMPEGDAMLALNAAGADPNAFTSVDMTAYHFECTDRFEENLRTLLSFVSTPYFTQASVDKERGIIEQEIRMYEDAPDYAVYTDLMKCLFAESPLRDAVAGTAASIAEITPELLYECHRLFYRPSNMALCIVGRADPDAVERIALELLPAESGPRPRTDYGPDEGLAPAAPGSRRTMEVAAPLFMIGAKLGPARLGPEGQRERLTASLALRTLAGRSSPFFLKHYADGLLNDTFGADVEYGAGQTVLAFDGKTARDPREVLDALRAELARVRREGLDPALFERQKKAALGGRIRALANFEAMAVGLASGHFCGFRPLEGLRLLPSVTADEAAAWLSAVDPDRLALAVIEAKEG